MRTNEEYEAWRDKLAAEMPLAHKYQFPTLNDLFAFVGLEPSANFAEQVAASVKAEAKLRYMYADAMMEARESFKEVAEEPVAGDDGWIPYDGSGMPCPPSLKVDVKFLNNNTDCCEAMYFDWRHIFGHSDIIAWRPAE